MPKPRITVASLAKLWVGTFELSFEHLTKKPGRRAGHLPALLTVMLNVDWFS
jgi:hypothetical protein